MAILHQAIALHNQGRLDEADRIYRQFLQKVPNHPDALHLRALVFHARGRFEDAATFAKAAIAVAPQVANFYNTAGEALRRKGELAQARRHLLEALRLDPALGMAHHNLALVFGDEGNYDAALASSRRALSINPAHVEALAHNLDMTCILGDEESAQQIAEQLRKHGDNGIAKDAVARYHIHRARALLLNLRFDEASLEAAQAISANPAFWGGWAALGEISNELADASAAEFYCSMAMNLAPDNPDACLNLAHLLKEQKRLDEAEVHYSAWLATHPDDAAARFGLAGIYLMRGDYAAGWKNYEYRWKLGDHADVKFSGIPQWKGEKAAALLLYSEQGLGDTLQMLRFLPQATARSSGKVTLLLPTPLARVAQRVMDAIGVAVSTEPPPANHFDFACPLMSLPGILGADTPERVTIAAPYMAADPERIAHFKSLLSTQPGRTIGIVWRGGQAGTANRRRKLAEDDLAPLLTLSGWTPVSLQFGVREPTIASLPLVDISQDIADFDDLAAAMKAVDVVVTLDSGPAHLAGALGIPCFTLVPWLHDWRWGVDGERSSWYPAMTLVRQTVPGSWAEPVERLLGILNGSSPQPGKSAAAECPVADHPER